MKKIYKEFLKSLVLGIIIFIIMILVSIANGQTGISNQSIGINFYYIMLYTVSLHIANTFVFAAMDRIFDKNVISVKRLATGFTSSFIVSLLVVFLLRMAESVFSKGESLSTFVQNESPSNYYIAMVITLVVTLVMHAFYFYKKYQENRVKEQKIIAGTASAKFESLKNQIDPHFLFNSLNVLSSLIEENPDNAQRFTTSLSKVYRYVLEQKDKELVSVEEELAFANTYMNLLKMRFENSVFFEVPQTISNPEAKVVPLSLQLLLENTIKHNVVSPQRPLHIKIVEQGGYLVVENNYQKKEILQDRQGVGLQNILSRYAIITAKQVVIEQTEQHFKVKLPILTKQVLIMETNLDKTKNSYYKAQKKVEEIKGFYGNLISYAIIITGLAILNFVTTPDYLWFFFPAIGWGIGVVIHGMHVYEYMPFLGSEWEQKKIKEIMQKNNAAKWQ